MPGCGKPRILIILLFTIWRIYARKNLFDYLLAFYVFSVILRAHLGDYKMIKRLAIYDMDGTIVCSLHRYKIMQCGKRIDLEFWRANEYRAFSDSLLPLAAQYRADCNDAACYVIIATARVIGREDARFITEILGQPDYIISRGAGDTRSGAELKIKGLQKFRNLVNFRLAWDNAVFYEDNFSYLRAVCEFFKIRGVYIPSEQGH